MTEVVNRRRRLLTVLGAMPWIADRAQGAEPKILGALDPFPGSDPDAGLRRWMKKFGYAEANIQKIVVLRSEGRDELLPKLATDLVALRPDVIVTWGDAAARATQAATRSIPIVVMTDNLSEVGRVDSLNRPGGNMTGISVLATELDVKRLEILALLLPARSTVMLLADAVTLPLSRPGLRQAGRALGLQLTEVIVRTSSEMQRAFESAQGRGIAGVNVLASPLLFAWREELIGWTNAARLPAIFEWGFLADGGALIAYGPLLEPLYRRFMNQIMGLLRGGRVADFPVEQPTLFELVVNLKTAKAIGVDVPQSLIVRADRVIR